MMFALRHSERSEESLSLNKEAEKLFSEHALALLPRLAHSRLTGLRTAPPAHRRRVRPRPQLVRAIVLK